MRKLGPGRGRRPIVLPFVSHQVLDYLVALYLLQVGAKLQGRPATVCYVAGSLMLAGAAFSGRPLGGGRLSRPLHRLVDAVLIVGLAAAPFVFGFTDDVPAMVNLEGLAVALLAIVWCTNYGRPQPGSTARALKDKGPRVAGQLVGRRLSNKRRPPDPS